MIKLQALFLLFSFAAFADTSYTTGFDSQGNSYMGTTTTFGDYQVTNTNVQTTGGGNYNVTTTTIGTTPTTLTPITNSYHHNTAPIINQ